jgi:CubicO group peptidase (beta-lactamase class C family)
MSTAKKIKLVALFIIVIVLAGAVIYAWYSFPIVSGYNAKNACSCIFIGGQKEDDVKKQELGEFPKSLASIKVDYKDSSVTAKVWLFAKRKAIFRKGLGCTLVNEISEKDLLAQKFSLPVIVKPATDSIDWPMGDRLSSQLPQGLNQDKLNGAIDYAFIEKDSSKKRYTRAVIVLYKGELVAEKYAEGFDQHSIMLGWSMAKSFMNALIGVLVQRGKLQLSMNAPIDQWNDPKDPRHAITVEHLLQQTSGLNFTENYSRYSEVTNMLFNKGDMPAYAANRSLKDKPGTVFNYTSGNSNLLSLIVRKTAGEDAYHSFPYEAIFKKMGMWSAMLEPDAAGNFVASSYVWATARDYARFGLLYLNDGVFNGERILPEGWVQKTREPAIGNQYKNYGYQFWLNGFDEKDIHKQAYPGVPADMFYADGYGGQDIYIIPSKKLVVVRLGVNAIDEDGFLKRVCAAVE